MSSVSTSNVPFTHGLDGFISFISEDCIKVFPPDSSLADHIDYWLWSGHGVVKCFGSFEIFLKVIPLIVDEWYRHPGILHFCGSEDPPPFERHATSAFGHGDELHAIFDRDHFTAAVFIWQHLEPR